jgi:hypothetical protein
MIGVVLVVAALADRVALAQCKNGEVYECSCQT